MSIDSGKYQVERFAGNLGGGNVTVTPSFGAGLYYVDYIVICNTTTTSITADLRPSDGAGGYQVQDQCAGSTLLNVRIMKGSVSTDGTGIQINGTTTTQIKYLLTFKKLVE